LNPKDFNTFAEFFNLLSVRLKEDRIPDRRFVIIIDALNESPEPTRILREALEMVQASREHPWVRIVLSAREEFLFAVRGRTGELEANPFYPLLDLFVHPPEDTNRPRRPEDPPAWDVPAFTEQEAETVYRRYQRAKAEGQIAYACNTPWERIPPPTRRDVLLVPLHLDLWMHAFDGREAPAITGVQDLFEHYLDDARKRFPRFWESMQVILDFMLERGRTELDDWDAHEIEARWSERLTEEERRLRFSPLEVACVSGVMRKRTTEEGGGYRIPHQRLREQLFYARLKEKDPSLRSESLHSWLSLPPTEELEGALAQIAEDLWEMDRTGELTIFVEAREEEMESWLRRLLGAEIPMGVRALERMFARRLEIREDPETIARRLSTLLDALPDEEQTNQWMRSLLIFDVPERVEGLPVTRQLQALWETALLSVMPTGCGSSSLWKVGHSSPSMRHGLIFSEINCRVTCTTNTSCCFF